MKILRLFLVVIALAQGGGVFAAGMGVGDARHLLSRTGFGPTWAEIQAYASLSRADAIERILADTRVQASVPPPSWVATFEPPVKMKALTEEERQRVRKTRRQQQLALKRWWFAEMRATPSPLTERMTLFWHGHFTSALSKVQSPVLMYRQNLLLRAHALGRFDALLHDIAKDPAMLIYLDGRANRKGRPNENFAREVMELFTLGEGHYTEADVKAAARAFTGWTVDRNRGSLVFRPGLHDRGVKRLLGRRGRFDGDQVLDLLLARPETAAHITCKLWQELVSPLCDEAEVKRIGALFREHHYDIKTLVHALLGSDAFWAASNRGVIVKSPVEFLIGTRRQLGLPVVEDARLVRLSSQLGQNLFEPPNVKGWPGGESWLDGRTLLLRQQVLRNWSRAQRPRPASAAADPKGADKPAKPGKPGDFAVKTWVEALGGGADWHARARQLLLPLAPLRLPDEAQPSLGYVRDLLLDPVYQLK
ncbi:DUF1800 domain-containing protein [Thiocystis violacea]|uniref:DUF1800 domain-containing protein n=1 Tax=Thiocystis violacea TaxID=13725 RepID=UPI001903A71F|nr:DUF1800 domain-containing protein [Thiocystis violacea]MBK1722964.1 hypothetical protein [Thiocystis violacea]